MTTNIGTAEFVLDLDRRAFDRQLEQAVSDLTQAGDQAAENFAKGFSGASKDLAPTQRKIQDNLQDIGEKGGKAASVGFGQAFAQGIGVGLGIRALEAALDTLSRAIVGPIQDFASFEETLTLIDNKVPETAADLEDLAGISRDVAQVTSQSAVSALAAADSYIALGASVEDAERDLASIAETTDALAGIGAEIEQVAQISQIAASSFAQFGFTTQQINDLLITLVNSTAAGSSGLDEFEQLFSKAGATTAQVGGDLNDVLAVFGALRQSGASARVAANAIKNLQLVLATSAEDVEAFNIQVFDSNGEFRSLSTILAEFEQVFGSFTQQQRLVVSEGIFGREFAAPFLAALGQANTLIPELQQRLETSSGAARQQVEAINSTLAGQLRLIEGILSDVSLQLGQAIGPAVQGFVSVFQDALTSLAQSGVFSSLQEEALSFVAALEENEEFAAAFTQAIVDSFTVLSDIGASIISQLAENVDSIPLLIEATADSFQLLADVFVATAPIVGSVAEGLLILSPILPALTQGLIALQAAQITYNVAAGAYSAAVQVSTAASSAYSTALSALQASQAGVATSAAGSSGALQAVSVAFGKATASATAFNTSLVGVQLTGTAAIAAVSAAAIGAVAAIAAVADTFRSVEQAAAATRESTDLVADSLDRYEASLGSTASAVEDLAGATDDYSRSLETASQDLNGFQRGLDSVRSFVGLTTAAEAQLTRQQTAFGDLATQTDKTLLAFERLRARGYEATEEQLSLLQTAIEDNLLQLSSQENLTQANVVTQEAYTKSLREARDALEALGSEQEGLASTEANFDFPAQSSPASEPPPVLGGTEDLAEAQEDRLASIEETLDREERLVELSLARQINAIRSASLEQISIAEEAGRSREDIEAESLREGIEAEQRAAQSRLAILMDAIAAINQEIEAGSVDRQAALAQIAEIQNEIVQVETNGLDLVEQKQESVRREAVLLLEQQEAAARRSFETEIQGLEEISDALAQKDELLRSELQVVAAVSKLESQRLQNQLALTEDISEKQSLSLEIAEAEFEALRQRQEIEERIAESKGRQAQLALQQRAIEVDIQRIQADRQLQEALVEGRGEAEVAALQQVLRDIDGVAASLDAQVQSQREIQANTDQARRLSQTLEIEQLEASLQRRVASLAQESPSGGSGGGDGGGEQAARTADDFLDLLRMGQSSFSPTSGAEQQAIDSALRAFAEEGAIVTPPSESASNVAAQVEAQQENRRQSDPGMDRLIEQISRLASAAAKPSEVTINGSTDPAGDAADLFLQFSRQATFDRSGL